MRRQHAAPRMEIPISMEVYHQLIMASTNTGFEKEDWEIAAEAIDEWTRRHDPDALPPSPASGYQWKRLFLPDGTLLRTVFGGKNYHCLVESDRITYDGKAVSPSGFVNAVGGIRRNAWLCTWILFPNSKQWKLADTLRTRERPRRSRKPAPASRQAQATQAAAAQPAPAYQPAPATQAAAAQPALASRQAPATQAVAAQPAVHVAPIAGATPVQIEPIVARKSGSLPIQQAIPAQVARVNPSGEDAGRRQRAGIALTRPQCVRGAERRTGGNDRIAALLRQ